MAIRHSTTVTTSSSGAVTAYVPESGAIQGKVYAIHYVRDDLSTGSDFTITGEAFGEQLWTESNVNASKTVYPRRTVNTTTGGSTTTREAVVLANDRVKIVIAQGGNALSGTFTVVTDA